MKLHWNAYSKTDECIPIYGGCPNCEQGYAIRKVGHRMEGTTDRCQFCDGTGKVLSAWAREVNNA